LSFRTRLTIVAAAAVSLAVVAASLVTLVVIRNQLRGQVDDALRSRAREIVGSPNLHIEGGYLEGAPPPSFGGGDFVQIVDRQGRTTLTHFESGNLPPSETALGIAQKGGGARFNDATIKGLGAARVYTIPVRDQQGNTYALQVARSLGEVNHTLHRITIFLVLIALGGIFLEPNLITRLDDRASGKCSDEKGAQEKWFHIHA
jgi:two-component system sensor histidine kinase MprB